MDYKKANRAYLYAIISTMALTVLYAVWVNFRGGSLNIIANNILSEMVVLIPVLAVVLFHGEKLGNVIIFKRIRIKSVLLTLLYVLLVYPLITFVNSISMLFVDNTVLEIADEILSLPAWQVLISIGIFGPFVEEVVFRGVLLQSYQRTGRIMGSIILSALLFGLIHLNFNQFAYGAVMGVMLALLVEATGSVWSSLIAHGIFNSIEVIAMFASRDAVSEASQYIDGFVSGDRKWISIGLYFIAAVIITPLALCVVYKISEVEGRKAFFAAIPKCRKQGYKLITFPLILAVFISLAYMIIIEFLLSLT